MPLDDYRSWARFFPAPMARRWNTFLDELEAIKSTADAAASSIITDHGGLTGLTDDDHTDYHTDVRGDLRYLQLSGGTLTGDLTLDADPDADLKAATKQYVDDIKTWPNVKVQRTSDLTLTASATTIVDWTSERYDTDAIHDNSTNPSRLTIPTGEGGKWLIGAKITINDPNADCSARVRITKNGNTWTDEYMFFFTTDNLKKTTRLVELFDASAGDYYEIKITNFHTSSLTLHDDFSRFWAIKCSD